MQFGSSSRVLKVGYVVLLTVFGTLTARAQYTDFGQALGGTSGQQQVTCNPQDLACQATQQNPADQGNLQRRLPSTNQQPNPQGVVLPGQETQNDNTSGNQTQQQRQQVPPRLPLDSPTEFQQMVANSIGKQLPIYGVNLFRNPPSTFAPLIAVPVTPEYVIGPGDELLIKCGGRLRSTADTPSIDRGAFIYPRSVRRMLRDCRLRRCMIF